jgi:hypothetical protein
LYTFYCIMLIARCRPVAFQLDPDHVFRQDEDTRNYCVMTLLRVDSSSSIVNVCLERILGKVDSCGVPP